jgi:molybdate transport system substrate-binding protein
MLFARRLLLILGLLAALPAFADSLLIAAGAGYKRPVAELSAAFEKQAGIRVEQIYGNMGNIVAQVKQGGEIAVVFGDHAYLSKVEGIDFASYLELGAGRLVVAWPTGGKLETPVELAEPRFARIAVPNPKAAIYGIAASEFLAGSQLATQVKDRLQVVATVPQVSAYLISGEVDAGFINLTEALAIAPKIGGYREIDARLYTPIRIVGGVLRPQADKASVQALGRFLKSPEARAILAKHGL